MLSNKTYWSILETFYNGKKVPITSPLFINNKFVIDFQEKVNVLTLFTQNNTRRFQAAVSCLWKYHVWQSTVFNLCFGKSDVIKLIKDLDVSKAHGHDEISVKMIRICDDSITHRLTLIFQNSLVAGIFTNDWKKANIPMIQFMKKKW